MKLFYLSRIEDETGISGTGRVAEGVIFSDGRVALRWISKHRSTAIYDNINDVLFIHGHNGKTELIFVDA